MSYLGIKKRVSKMDESGPFEYHNPVYEIDEELMHLPEPLRSQIQKIVDQSVNKVVEEIIIPHKNEYLL
jgi:hypothetical protein